MKWFVREETVLFKRTGKENVINSTNIRWNFKKKNPTRSLQLEHFYNNVFVLLKVNKKGEKKWRNNNPRCFVPRRTHIAPDSFPIRGDVIDSAAGAINRWLHQPRCSDPRVYIYMYIYAHACAWRIEREKERLAYRKFSLDRDTRIYTRWLRENLSIGGCAQPLCGPPTAIHLNG